MSDQSEMIPSIPQAVLPQDASYPHLDPETVPLLLLDDLARIKASAEVKFIEHSEAGYLLDTLQDLYDQPIQEHMDGLLIAGPTFSGKTSLAKFFASLYPRQENRGKDHAIQTVAYTLTPDKPDVEALHRMILKSIGGPCPMNEQPGTVRERLLLLAKTCGLKMLFLDEIHGVLNGSPKQQRHIMSVLKNLSNAMEISIVLLGTREAFLAVSLAEEVDSRFPVEWLPAWTDDAEFRGLLNAFERQLPLKKPSGLDEQSSVLFKMSGGSLGWLSRLLVKAAKAAITSGEERITPELLAGLRWKAPQQRLELRRQLEGGEAHGGAAD